MMFMDTGRDGGAQDTDCVGIPAVSKIWPNMSGKRRPNIAQRYSGRTAQPILPKEENIYKPTKGICKATCHPVASMTSIRGGHNPLC
jgi:hypothetical protein